MRATLTTVAVLGLAAFFGTRALEANARFTSSAQNMEDLVFESCVSDVNLGLGLDINNRIFSNPAFQHCYKVREHEVEIQESFRIESVMVGTFS